MLPVLIRQFTAHHTGFSSTAHLPATTRTGSKMTEKRLARSGRVGRTLVATVEKFLPWLTPEIHTAEIRMIS